MSKPTPKLPPYVILKHGKWHVRISTRSGMRDKAGRIVYYQTVRRCDPETPARAQEIIDSLKSEAKEAKAQAEDPLVNEFIESFLQTKKKGIGKRTSGHYDYVFERYIRKGLGLYRLKDVTTLGLQKWIDSLDASADGVQRVHMLLTMAFKYAVLWGVITENPCKHIILPPWRRSESLSMSKAEVDKFLAYCKTDDKHIIWEFGLETGLRPQEILALSWSDVDLVKNKVRVRRALIEGAGPLFLDHPKTETSLRTVKITPYLSSRLARHKEIQLKYLTSLRSDLRAAVLLKHLKAKGVNYQRRKTRHHMARTYLSHFAEYDLVFPAMNGKPQSRGNLNRREFKDALKAAGISTRYSVKHLRHTNATLLAEKLNPKQLQQRLGHSRLNTTLNFYVHLQDDEAKMDGDLESTFYD